MGCLLPLFYTNFRPLLLYVSGAPPVPSGAHCTIFGERTVPCCPRGRIAKLRAAHSDVLRERIVCLRPGAVAAVVSAIGGCFRPGREFRSERRSTGRRQSIHPPFD